MKKTVIKRRKRVPAAAGVNTSPGGRISDQAAAETLIAVGRASLGGGGSGTGGEDSDAEGEVDEEQQPPRKRRATRKSRGAVAVSARRTRSTAGDKEADEDDEETSASVGRDGGRKRGQNGWDAGSGRSASPQHLGQQQLHRVPSRGHIQHQPHHPHMDYHHQQQMMHRSSPFGNVGSVFELPPLGPSGLGGQFAGLIGGGVPSSYIRSGSNAPSRTHSPLAGGIGGPGYGMPAGGAAYYGADVSGMMGLINMSGAVPTVGELERHYAELNEQKRRMEEMVERTERLMVGVKRGIDEMRGTGQSRQGSPVQQVSPVQQGSPLARGQSQPQPQQEEQHLQHQHQPQPQQQDAPPPSSSPSLGNMGAPAVPLVRPTPGGERRESVWSVVDSNPAPITPALGAPVQN
jgi:GATA-binding protein